MNSFSASDWPKHRKYFPLGLHKKTHRVLAAVLTLGAAACSDALAGAIAHHVRSFPSVKAHVITVNLSSPSVTVTAQIAGGGPGHSESFRSMLRKSRPTAAITGAFFDTVSKHPVGDITINGEKVANGVAGDGLCVTADGRVEIVPRYIGKSTGWKDYQTVLCGGPTLIRNGSIALSPKSQGFRDSGLRGRHSRTAVGLTDNNKLLLVSINSKVSLMRLALIMKELGCTDAITLDGGSSTGLWFNGKILSHPSRNLTNLLEVHYNPVRSVAKAEPYTSPPNLPSITSQ